MADDKVVTELRTELWEKERKLTDIRLEALSSAHRLEQLQEAMTSMQVGNTAILFITFTVAHTSFSCRGFSVLAVQLFSL